MTISEAISNAAAALAKAGIPEPRREASSLLSYVVKQNTAFLIAHSDDHLAAPYKMMLDACVRRRANREPLQYITGRQEFYGLEFSVNPDVLIPRPETEILVEKAVKILSSVDSPRFCEIGVGSGCISIAILREAQHAVGVGIDVSEKALGVALQNAGRHDVANRLTLVRGDIYDNIDDRFDMIVSNPPYIPSEQLAKLQAEVRDFEPTVALDGGDDGLDIIRRIVDGAPNRLKPQGYLLLEVGYDQADLVKALFHRAVWDVPSAINDLQQIPRIIVSSLRAA